MTVTSATIQDHAQRERALCVTGSFMVHAPAGSGKTDLLVKRYVALLATVKDPEEIVAITFTKKAAFEMKERVLKTLEGRNSSILPARLRILTIDALCAKLARSMPLMSELGDLPNITKDPMLLYQKAARALLQDEPWSDALWVLARHMQNRLALLEELFAQMLSTREQWLAVLMAARGQHREKALRAFLEGSMAQLREEALESFYLHCPRESEVWREMNALWMFVSSQQAQQEHDEISHIQNIAALCLTKTGQLRKTVDKRSGFGTDSPEMKTRMKALLEALSVNESLVERLQYISDLPPSEYADQDWAVVEALLEVLPLLVSHLQVIFLEKSEVDFSEIALRALHAMGEEDSPTELALMLDYQIRHILVDEFQDTSPIQFKLLESLVRGWEPQDGRTLFLVGDPMQSIYRFRQADVRLFHEAMKNGVGGVRLESLYLVSNFRSSPEIVTWVNQVFQRTAVPVKQFSGEILWTEVRETAQVRSSEALEMIHKIKKIREDNPGDSIAILGRSRRQVSDILAELLMHQIPAEAVDMQNLSEALIIRDLCSLLYAFSDETDKLSWMALLRSPWSGLSLEGLLLFSKALSAEKNAGVSCIEILKKLSREPLIQDSRVALLIEIYENACLQKIDLPLVLWLHQAFEGLGGAGGLLDPKEVLAIEQFFRLLEEFSPWALPDRSLLEYALLQRFIRAESEVNSVQVMTIHKSKGLEFDHVFVPKLHRLSARDDLSLLLFEERLTSQGWRMLMAPIKSPQGESSALYRYLYREEQARAEAENLRVLYVAATRAKKTLNFSFTVNEKAGESAEKAEFKPIRGSFLSYLWPWAEGACMSAQHMTQSLSAKKNQWHRIAPAAATLQTKKLDINSPINMEMEKEDLNHPEFPVLETLKDRAIGTITHRYLKYFSDLQENSPEKTHFFSHPEGLKTIYPDPIKAQLRDLGVSLPEDLESSMQKILEALIKTLHSPTGQWLLSHHPEAQSEFRIVHRQGNLVNFYVVDRTFASENVRVIMDYKIAELLPSESIEDFFERLKMTYSPQLNRYATLMREMGELREIKTGLYCPLQDALIWI